MESTEDLAAVRDFDEDALVIHLEQRVEAERRAVERELHDEVSGMLAAARMDVSFLKTRAGKAASVQEHLERLDGTLDRAIRATRRIMQSLRPALLDHFGLPVALKHHVEETCRAAGLKSAVQMPEEFHAVDPQLQIATFRIVQKLLGTGAGLDAFEVEMFELPDSYRLEIRIAQGAVPIAGAVAAENLDLASLRIWMLSLDGQWAVQRIAAGVNHTLQLPRKS